MKFTTKNIWMSDRFEAVISSYPKKGKAQPLASHTLPRVMSDSEIIKEFVITPISVPDFLATADRLMKDKKDLLTNGYSNLFYVSHEGRVLVLGVDWLSGVEGWRWSCFELDEDGSWSVGLRVFSPRTVETEALETDSSLALRDLDARLRRIEKLFNLEALATIDE